MSRLHVQTNHTPAFVREYCTQKFMLCTEILDQIILGGLPVSEEAGKELEERGATVVEVEGRKMQVATVNERLKAIEMYGKFGPGVRVDARGEDGPPRRSVVGMPPWEDEVEAIDVTEQGALPSGDQPAED